MPNFLRSNPLPRRYRKVIILSRPRSGTNLLLSLLNAHPDIHLHGELLSATFWIRHTVWKRRLNYYLTLEMDPIRYLQTETFPRDGEGNSVIGFKLFPYHLRTTPEFMPAGKFLGSIPDLHIIELKRENLLDCVVSDLVAKRDKRYHMFEGAPPPFFQPIRIPYEKCVEQLDMVTQSYEEVKNFYPDQPRYALTYEDIVYRKDDVMHTLQEWLGVTPMILNRSWRLARQRRVPKRMAIENFDELRTRMEQEHPEWLRFFDDDPEEPPAIEG